VQVKAERLGGDETASTETTDSKPVSVPARKRKTAA